MRNILFFKVGTNKKSVYFLLDKLDLKLDLHISVQDWPYKKMESYLWLPVLIYDSKQGFTFMS